MSGRSTASVIVPVYSAEKHLSATMRSLCTQTPKDLEMIRIDDCSTDTSLYILRDFAAYDPRARTIRNPRNLGAALTRKRGIGESLG